MAPVSLQAQEHITHKEPFHMPGEKADITSTDRPHIKELPFWTRVKVVEVEWHDPASIGAGRRGLCESEIHGLLSGCGEGCLPFVGASTAKAAGSLSASEAAGETDFAADMLLIGDSLSSSITALR